MANRLLWESLEQYPVSHTRIKPHPVMTHEEAAELLTFAGLVWFVSDAAGLDDPERTASLVEAGLPWPLWKNREWLSIPLNVSDTHATFLKKMFRPNAPFASEHWSEIAQKTGQDEADVQEVESALYGYIDCLTTYWRLSVIWNN